MALENRHVLEARTLIGFVRCGYVDLRTYERLVTHLATWMARVEAAEIEAAEAWARVAELEQAGGCDAAKPLG